VTLELESPALGALELAPAPARAARAQEATAAWSLSAEHWNRLAPRGVYAERVRAPFLLLVTCTLLPLALALGLLVALVNACAHRSLARAFFTQPRVGWRGRVFVLWKFRTMRDGQGDDVARVTRLGRFLRNTHLDELPQLWNVLRGDMCLIGPRPEMLATERWAAEHCPGFSERLCLKPGLTGYAQISQGYTDSGDVAAYSAKRALNQRYLDELSFATDAAILVRTVAWMLRARGWRRA
jgi:lipopolysaccharide/colanic/teichoic acid biosynthesis glycosyltransferase